MDAFLSQIETYVHTSPWLAVAAVFLGGILTSCAPCVLVMVPMMMGFVAGRSERKLGVGRSLMYSALFVLGLAITFCSLGMAAALFNQLYGQTSAAWNWIVVAVCLLMGLHMLGLLPFTIPALIKRQPQLTGVLGALVLGLLFGFVSAPCAGPILVVLLTYLAGSDASVAYGAVLLLAYALGHSLLILVAGTSVGLARKMIESKRMARGAEIMKKVAGAVIVLVGAWFAYQALK